MIVKCNQLILGVKKFCTLYSFVYSAVAAMRRRQKRPVAQLHRTLLLPSWRKNHDRLSPGMCTETERPGAEEPGTGLYPDETETKSQIDYHDGKGHGGGVVHGTGSLRRRRRRRSPVGIDPFGVKETGEIIKYNDANVFLVIYLLAATIPYIGITHFPRSVLKAQERLMTT
ncbi:hypothetical protein MPTK1_2g02060 [Marchantia polymorpha subsp. ruderalis]|uniref:Uncharacterized protein n=1 Tax=Marchantia polymorpha TaxID=3197 RepID=A0A2R6W872_MARPO|nr:hypothetical protein MARPO_0130s0014 [Marchantia polymorpha]BBN00781.1 hypothetical protein Mp_2g02060 [Marchantia polymorpha subsp. ruderalis]|eukprot:PTQ30058.1 hypothetical protein MARPO_0130s0014 [Marchantia polymorpha]